MTKRKTWPVVLLLCLSAILFLAAFISYKTYFEKPEPISVHAFYKRPNWNWLECDADLLTYGDKVTFQHKNIRYTLPCDDFVAWSVGATKKPPKDQTKNTEFTITLPNDELVQGVCYPPYTPDGENTCIIVNTGVVQYYVSPDRVRFK